MAFDAVVNLAGEVWSPCAGFESAYEVSNAGRVRSLDRISCADRKLRGVVLNPALAGAGYLFVTLCADGRRSQRYVHRLVAQAFIRNEYGKYAVNHKNGDKRDNRVENLEWVTHAENVLHAISELGKSLPPNRGGDGFVRPVVGVCMKTGETVRFKSQREAQRAGFSQREISDCLHGRQKTHRGYRWEDAQ